MSVQQQGNRQHNSLHLIPRLARRIMSDLGRDHRWKEDEGAYFNAHMRVSNMDDQTLFRYVNPHLVRDEIDMKRIAMCRELLCKACYCGYEGEHECKVDHSAGIGLREIMIHLICEAVCEAVCEERWEYFKAA